MFGDSDENRKHKLAKVSALGFIQEVDVQLVPKVCEGDYILVHAGFAIQIINQDIARESISLWEDMGLWA